MEMAATDEMVEIATRLKPYQSTIVPERREEITTEGGLRVYGEESRLKDAVKALKDAGIVVSLFIDPELKEIDSAKEVGAEVIELHTGEYANATSKEKKAIELNRLRNAAEYASSIGLEVSAGHGLTYYNVRPVAEIEKILELNIGHTIIARSIFTGLERAIKDMITIIRGA